MCLSWFSVACLRVVTALDLLSVEVVPLIGTVGSLLRIKIFHAVVQGIEADGVVCQHHQTLLAVGEGHPAGIAAMTVFLRPHVGEIEICRAAAVEAHLRSGSPVDVVFTRTTTEPGYLLHRHR